MLYTFKEIQPSKNSLPHLKTNVGVIYCAVYGAETAG